MKKLLILLLVIGSVSGYSQEHLCSSAYTKELITIAKKVKRKSFFRDVGIATAILGSVGSGAAAAVSLACYKGNNEMVQQAAGWIGVAGAIAGAGVGVGIYHLILKIEGMPSTRENSLRSLESKMYNLSAVQSLINTDMFVSGEVLHNRQLERMEKTIQQKLAKLRAEGVSEEELQNIYLKEVAKIQFSNRSDFFNETSTIDLLAKLKGINVSTLDKFEIFRQRVVRTLKDNTYLCQENEDLYGLKQISEMI